MSGDADLDRMVSKLRALRGLVASAAPESAKAFEEQLRKTVDAGAAPDGTPWKPKKDGGRALEFAGEAITVTSTGTSVVATLEGNEVWHHYGTKRVPKRQVLPTALNESLGAALRSGMVKTFRRTMGGGL